MTSMPPYDPPGTRNSPDISPEPSPSASPGSADLRLRGELIDVLTWEDFEHLTMRPGLTDDTDTTDDNDDARNRTGNRDGTATGPDSRLITPAPSNTVSTSGSGTGAGLETGSLPVENRDDGPKPGLPASQPRPGAGAGAGAATGAGTGTGMMNGNPFERPPIPTAGSISITRPTRELPTPRLAGILTPLSNRSPSGSDFSTPNTTETDFELGSGARSETGEAGSDTNSDSDSHSDSHSNSHSDPNVDQAPSFPIPSPRPGAGAGTGTGTRGPDSPTGPPDVLTPNQTRLDQDPLLQPPVPQDPSLTLHFARTSGPHVRVFAPRIQTGFHTTRTPRPPHVYPPLLPTATTPVTRPATRRSTLVYSPLLPTTTPRATQATSNVTVARQGDPINHAAPPQPPAADPGPSRPIGPVSTWSEQDSSESCDGSALVPRESVPSHIVPPGAETDHLWIDPFTYRLVTGQEYAPGDQFGDEQRALVNDWLRDQRPHCGPLWDTWTALTPVIMMDPDERPAPFATVRDGKVVLHVALHKIDELNDEYDGNPERLNKLTDDYYSIGVGSTVAYNMINGQKSYYLRLMPCFCTPANTSLYKASHHHVNSDPGIQMDVEMVDVALCPNRFPHNTEARQRRSGSNPIPIPVPIPIPIPGAMAPAPFSGWNSRRQPSSSLLTPRDAIGSRAVNPRRTTIGSWIHDQLEPLEYAYPIIDEVKWGALRPRERSPYSAPVIVPDNPAPAVVDGPNLATTTATLASGTNTTIPPPRPTPVFYLQNSPDSQAETPPPRYTGRNPNPPPRYTSAPPRNGGEGEERQTVQRPVFPPRFPPYGDRPYRRGNAATAPPVPDPPSHLLPLATNEPSLLRLNRPPHETLSHYSRHLPLNPTVQQVREYMSDPVVVRELERHGIVYRHDPVEGHTWRWRGLGRVVRVRDNRVSVR